MDILNEDVKKDLKEKFTALDINDEKFEEKAKAIVEETLTSNKDKIGKIVETKTVDEAFEEEKEGFEEAKQLLDEGVLDDIEDESIREALKNKAKEGILDEATERVSLKEAGFSEDPNKQTAVEDIIEEIFRQLEEVVEEKKQKIQEEIDKKEKMLGKVEKREKLRASRLKVDNLHQKTKNFKGKEGQELNENVESALTDLDKQINVLVAETTIDGKELQSDELKQERDKLLKEKKDLEDMFKSMKENYTKDHAKESNKVLIKDDIKDEIGQIIGDIDDKVGPSKLAKMCEELKKLYDESGDKLTEEELREVFEKVPIKVDEEIEEPITAVTLASAGDINDIRRKYVEKTNEASEIDEGDTDKIEANKDEVKLIKEQFEDKKKILRAVCGPDWTILPLRTESQYRDELQELEVDAEDEKGILFKKGKKAKEANRKTKNLRWVLKELMSVFKNKETIRSSYNRIVDRLSNNYTLENETLPKKLEEDKKAKKDIREDVKVDDSKIVIPEFLVKSRKEREEKAITTDDSNETPKKEKGMGRDD